MLFFFRGVTIGIRPPLEVQQRQTVFTYPVPVTAYFVSAQLGVSRKMGCTLKGLRDGVERQRNAVESAWVGRWSAPVALKQPQQSPNSNPGSVFELRLNISAERL